MIMFYYASFFKNTGMFVIFCLMYRQCYSLNVLLTLHFLNSPSVLDGVIFHERHLYLLVPQTLSQSHNFAVIGESVERDQS